METNLLVKGLCLVAFGVAPACRGVELAIENAAGIPFKVTVVKEGGESEERLVSTHSKEEIGYLGDMTKDNVGKIVNIEFLEGWQQFGKRLLQWQNLPVFSSEAAQELDRILTIFKNKAPRLKPGATFIIIIGLNEQNELTFNSRVEGSEWVVLPGARGEDKW
jgi:hypothetical protein